MEIHIQKCQQCGSRSLRNILARDTRQMVYVQCRNCSSMVARYILSKGGYYHSGKGFESFLRSVERDGGFASGRSIQLDFDEMEKSIKDAYDNLQEQLALKYGDTLP